MNLTEDKRQLLNQFKINRRVMKAYLLKESLEGLWKQSNAQRAAEYLAEWVKQLH